MEIKAVWAAALPDVMRQVTGVGIWTALKVVTPIAFDEGNFVMGLDGKDQELAGHLKLALPKRVIEETMGRFLNEKVNLRVISGITLEDWRTEKIRDVERRKLQEQSLQRQRAELEAGRSWEKVYEQLSRSYAKLENRSMPQSRAKFFLDAIDIVAEALAETPVSDDMAERQYARCLDRVAQYTELPSAFVALKVLERAFGG